MNLKDMTPEAIIRIHAHDLQMRLFNKFAAGGFLGFVVGFAAAWFFCLIVRM